MENASSTAQASWFRKFSSLVSNWTGSQSAFALAIVFVLAWAASGHYFHYSDTWQLIINTGSSIITFLMVFLIQNTQNRESKIVHIKLDELLRATKAARNKLISLEDLADIELDRLHEEFRSLHSEAALQLQAISHVKLKKGEVRDRSGDK